MVDHVDVAVVGAGPAGAATAIVLAERGCRVVLLDAGARRGEEVGEILSPGVAPVLRRLGVWDGFTAGPHLRVHARLSAWGGSLVEQSSIINPHGPGWLIDRQAFDRLFVQRSADLGVIQRTARVTACRSREGGGWCLDVDGEMTLTAGAIVDSTGRGCCLSRAVGASVQVRDRLTAVVGWFNSARGPAVPPLVEAIPEGWLYSATVPSGALIAVLVRDLVEPDASLAEIWVPALFDAACTRGRVAGAQPAGPLTTHEVTVQTAILATTVPCVSVGDAALGLDPLSGGGLRVGLETAIEAAGAVAALLDHDHEPAAVYAAGLRHRFAQHVMERAHYYTLEDRWPNLPFWAARRADLPRIETGSGA